MNMLNKLACAAAVTLAFAGSAHAGVVMNDWKFNPTGTGLTGAQTINEYLDVNGNSFIFRNSAVTLCKSASTSLPPNWL